MKPVTSALGIYAATLTIICATLLLMGAKSLPGNAEFDTLTVHRLNVVEPDGTLRMVLSDHARFPGLILHGKEYPHARPQAGMLFFNDEGTEQGGLIYAGKKTDTGYTSGLSLTFDRYQQDQQLQLLGLDENGQAFAGLGVNDVPTRPIRQDIEELAKLTAMPEAEREKLMAKRRAEHYYGAQRFYAGKSSAGNSVVLLRDAAGKSRLALTVTPGGQASIDFLDADGKVERSITATSLANASSTAPTTPATGRSAAH